MAEFYKVSYDKVTGGPIVTPINPSPEDLWQGPVMPIRWVTREEMEREYPNPDAHLGAVEP